MKLNSEQRIILRRGRDARETNVKALLVPPFRTLAGHLPLPVVNPPQPRHDLVLTSIHIGLPCPLHKVPSLEYVLWHL